MVKIPRDLVSTGILAVICVLGMYSLLPGCYFLYILIAAAYFIWAYCISKYKAPKDKLTIVYCAVYALAWPVYVLVYLITFVIIVANSYHMQNK